MKNPHRARILIDICLLTEIFGEGAPPPHPPPPPKEIFGLGAPPPSHLPPPPQRDLRVRSTPPPLPHRDLRGKDTGIGKGILKKVFGERIFTGVLDRGYRLTEIVGDGILPVSIFGKRKLTETFGKGILREVFE